MKWLAKLDEAIIIDDKGLRTLLKRETGPEDFCEALCMRFKEEIERQLEEGTPLMVELAPHHSRTTKKAKKIYGLMTGN